MYYSKYNRRGRIALLEDASGFQTFKYGKMGEVIENNHTFVLPNENHQYSFRMQYSYDSWNRVQYISYPDGEMVYYKYNAGGMLESVYGRKVVQNIIASPGGRDAMDFNPTPPPSTTYTYRYIDSISYNKFELKSGQWYGNGTQAQYSYDILQRLENLKLYDNYRPRHLLQDITYTYDKASNIDTIRNAATTVSTLGGRYTYTYQYDSLYRLTGGAGNFANLKPLANYALSMTYAADGRILRKTQNGTTRLNGRAANFNTDISYTYNSRRPHTLYSAGGKAYTWNANGNLLSEGDPLIATRKYLQLAWDEENRMLSADMPQAHTCAIYAYDADGERFYRNVGARTEMTQNGQTYVYRRYGDPVLYPSPYVVCTPQGYTKHYFVESERLASRLGDGTISGLNNHVANAAALAAKQAKVNAAAPDSIVPNRFAILRQLQAHWSNHHTTYWQHGDHLGSASWITDTNGMGYQHLQYMPWGEPLVDQRVSGATYRSRYTFSGKERDEETGFSYFGARHYHPTLSIWLSVDPMSDKYPSTSPYTYCANNPVRLVDPDGRDVEYNSFVDRIITFFARVFNSDFRKMFKYLRKSDETYVFNKNNIGSNSFTTDGSKLFINYCKNYSYTENGLVRIYDECYNSLLIHETTHAIQFEYGEISFEWDAGGSRWVGAKYDIFDEFEAHTNQHNCFRPKVYSLEESQKIPDFTSDYRNWWDLDNDDNKKLMYIQSKYPTLLKESLFNTNSEKIHTDRQYALPHRTRYSSAGKSYHSIMCPHYWYPINALTISNKLDDTIFVYIVYFHTCDLPSSQNIKRYIDSTKTVAKYLCTNDHVAVSQTTNRYGDSTYAVVRWRCERINAVFFLNNGDTVAWNNMVRISKTYLFDTKYCLYSKHLLVGRIGVSKSFTVSKCRMPKSDWRIKAIRNFNSLKKNFN